MSDFEAQSRLETLWASEFGDDYVDRNIAAGEGRRDFWLALAKDLQPQSALEVGCNVGANLVWLAEALEESNLAGIDVNGKAVQMLQERLPTADLRVASGRELPFDDGSFDLVFTMGVLIHQDDEALPKLMDEIVRVAGRYVVCGEYYSADDVEVPYRGQRGALFKRDYGSLYSERNPNLALRDRTFLTREDGPSWDDVTVWTFEKPPGS